MCLCLRVYDFNFSTALSLSNSATKKRETKSVRSALVWTASWAIELSVVSNGTARGQKHSFITQKFKLQLSD